MSENKLLQEYDGHPPKNRGCAKCRHTLHTYYAEPNDVPCSKSYTVIFDPIWGLKKEYECVLIKNKDGQCEEFEEYHKCVWCGESEERFNEVINGLCQKCKKKRDQQKEEEKEEKKTELKFKTMKEDELKKRSIWKRIFG